MYCKRAQLVDLHCMLDSLVIEPRKLSQTKEIESSVANQSMVCRRFAKKGPYNNWGHAFKTKFYKEIGILLKKQDFGGEMD